MVSFKAWNTTVSNHLLSSHFRSWPTGQFLSAAFAVVSPWWIILFHLSHQILQIPNCHILHTICHTLLCCTTKSAINAPIFSKWLSYTKGYELFNCSNVRESYQWWNYRGCWHHALPLIAFQGLCTSKSAKYQQSWFSIIRHCLVQLYIGQFSRLLPPLELWAVSHAHSPESNPNSPFA